MKSLCGFLIVIFVLCSTVILNCSQGNSCGATPQATTLSSVTQVHKKKPFVVLAQTDNKPGLKRAKSRRPC